MVGVYWRTDYGEAVRLGAEAVIGILSEAKKALLEDAVFTLDRLDGTTMTV